MRWGRRSLPNFLQPYCIVLGLAEGKRPTLLICDACVLKKWARRQKQLQYARLRGLAAYLEERVCVPRDMGAPAAAALTRVAVGVGPLA